MGVTPPAGIPSAPVVAFEEWMHVVNTRLLPCVGRTERGEDFRGVFNRCDLGAIGMVTASRSGGTALWRTPKMIRQLDPEVYNLSLQLDGVGVSTFGDGTVKVLRPGAVALADSSRPVRHTSDSGLDAVVGLTVPYRLMPLTYEQVDRFTGEVLPVAHGVGAMLASMLAALARHQGELRTEAAIRVAGVITDLLTTTLADQLDHGRLVDPGQRDRATLAKAKAFIDANLHLPDLSAGMVATACAVSPRHLSRLFAGEGVAGWIRGRRVERIRRDLCDPALDHLPVGHLASRHGVVHTAHAIRIFKAVHGMTPGQYRRTWRESPTPPARDGNTGD
jgi:AraC-like DNA-binding protein